MSRYPFPEFPNGWFQIADRREFVSRKTLERHYLGHRLTLHCDAADPHPPEHPAGKIRLSVATEAGKPVAPWPLAERFGLIFVYYHDRGDAPSWELPPLAPFREPGWSEIKTTCLEIRSHPQEICENTADTAHLASVHGMEIADWGNIEVETEGPLLRIGVKMRIAPRADSANASVELQMWTENYGPALGVVHLANPDGTETFSTYAPTPRGGGRLDYRISTALRRPGTPEQIERALDHSHRYQCATVLEDVPIWENKAFHLRPKLSEVDGPIAEFRRWYAQYYSQTPEGLSEA